MKSACPVWLIPILAVATFSSSLAQVSVIGELSQDKTARPGEVYEGLILVRNDTQELQEAKVYQTDYTFHHSGTNSYGEPGSHPRSNAPWLSFNPAFLSLPPQATVAVNYSVNVPRDTTGGLNGTYWSMLMVEGISPGSVESGVPRSDKKEMGITQTIRYGIQIATTIAATGSRNIRFIETKLLRNSDEEPILQVDIENTGSIGLRPDVYVELFDAQGISRGKFEGVKYRIYPGTSVRQSIQLGSAPSGTYKALIVVDAGGDDAFAAQYTLTL